MYLTFSNLNSIHWLIRKKDIGPFRTLVYLDFSLNFIINVHSDLPVIKNTN